MILISMYIYLVNLETEIPWSRFLWLYAQCLWPYATPDANKENACWSFIITPVKLSRFSVLPLNDLDKY